MDGCHETFLDSKFVIDNLGKRSETVGCAGSVGDNIHGRVVGFVVDSHDKHRSISRRSRNDNLLGSSIEMLASLFSRSEDTSGFDNIVGSGITPLDVGGVHLSKDCDGFSVNRDRALVNLLDFSGVLAVSGVKVEHVLHVVRWDERIVHGNNVDHGIVLSGSHNETSNTSKSIDTDINRFEGLGGTLAIDNIRKFRLERSTSDQETIDIGVGRQIRCVSGVGGTSVQDTSVLSDIGTSNLTKVLTDSGMSILSLLGGSSQPSSNGPNGFVGNDDLLPVLLSEGIGIGLDLRKDKVIGSSGFAGLQGFTTASHDGKSLVKSILGLGGDLGVSFSLLTTL
mmetsp:Transcript_21330/g.31702  ORF Transcript_21330/g.31702 Transcript_21330/m.31702 type:complete len:338 (-) Transcript_21330:482-1495(-)